jgi:hypothetical protein
VREKTAAIATISPADSAEIVWGLIALMTNANVKRRYAATYCANSAEIVLIDYATTAPTAMTDVNVRFLIAAAGNAPMQVAEDV